MPLTASVPAPATEELRRALESALGTRVFRLRRRRAPYASDFHTERLSLDLAAGRRLPVFFKNFDRTQVHRRAPLDAAARELAAYRLLAGQGILGVPTLYGAVWDARLGRHWLFLEDVGDRCLKHWGTLKDWVRAIRWLARLHARFLDRPDDVLKALPRAARFDRAAVENLCAGAHQSLEELARSPNGRAALRPGEAERLRPLVDRFPRVFRDLLGQARTLIHGDCYSYNVLLPAAGPAPAKTRRVCFVDWEAVAFGPNTFDVAALALTAPPDARALLIRAYLDVFRRATGEKVLRSSFELALAAFPLYDLVAGLAGLDVDPSDSRRFRKRLGLPERLVEAERFLQAWSRPAY